MPSSIDEILLQQILEMMRKQRRKKTKVIGPGPLSLEEIIALTQKAPTPPPQPQPPPPKAKAQPFKYPPPSGPWFQPKKAGSQRPVAPSKAPVASRFPRPQPAANVSPPIPATPGRAPGGFDAGAALRELSSLRPGRLPTPLNINSIGRDHASQHLLIRAHNITGYLQGVCAKIPSSGNFPDELTQAQWTNLCKAYAETLQQLHELNPCPSRLPGVATAAIDRTLPGVVQTDWRNPQGSSADEQDIPPADPGTPAPMQTGDQVADTQTGWDELEAYDTGSNIAVLGNDDASATSSPFPSEASFGSELTDDPDKTPDGGIAPVGDNNDETKDFDGTAALETSREGVTPQSAAANPAAQPSMMQPAQAPANSTPTPVPTPPQASASNADPSVRSADPNWKLKWVNDGPDTRPEVMSLAKEAGNTSATSGGYKEYGGLIVQDPKTGKLGRTEITGGGKNEWNPAELQAKYQGMGYKVIFDLHAHPPHEDADNYFSWNDIKEVAKSSRLQGYRGAFVATPDGNLRYTTPTEAQRSLDHDYKIHNRGYRDLGEANKASLTIPYFLKGGGASGMRTYAYPNLIKPHPNAAQNPTPFPGDVRARWKD